MYTVVRSHEDKAMVSYLFGSLREKECKAINFHDNAYKICWQNEGTDFLLDGVEYDVVKTKLIDGRIYLLCITDTEEAERLSDMSLSYGVDHSRGVDYQLIFSDDCIVDEISNPIQIPTPDQQLARINNSLKDLTRDILLPPPQASFYIV